MLSRTFSVKVASRAASPAISMWYDFPFDPSTCISRSPGGQGCGVGDDPPGPNDGTELTMEQPVWMPQAVIVARMARVAAVSGQVRRRIRLELRDEVTEYDATPPAPTCPVTSSTAPLSSRQLGPTRLQAGDNGSKTRRAMPQAVLGECGRVMPAKARNVAVAAQIGGEMSEGEPQRE